jgi:hypothetical protein
MALEKLTELSVDGLLRRRGDAKLRTLRRRRRCSVDGESTVERSKLDAVDQKTHVCTTCSSLEV